jgi:ABC-type nitrate/sulfonate/bicarbonate transport system substrate-binding protein
MDETVPNVYLYAGPGSGINPLAVCAGRGMTPSPCAQETLGRHPATPVSVPRPRIITRRMAGLIRLLAVALIFKCSAALPGTAIPQDTERTQPVMRIAGSAWIGDAPTRVADVRGYFNAGLGRDSPERIETVQYHSGQQALAELLRDEADFALSTPTPVALALLAQGSTEDDPGRDLVVLASVSLARLSHHVIADGRLGISAPEDLRGQRIGIVLDTASHHSWYRFAGFHRISDQVDLVHTPVDQLSDALLSGRLGAVVAWDPWAERIRTDLGAHAVTFSMREFHMVDWLLVTRRHTARTRPDITDRILGAYRSAIGTLMHAPESVAHTDSGNHSTHGEALEHGSIIWELSLGWSILSNLDAEFQWILQRPDYSHLTRPPPARYLEGAPLARIAPHRVKLPAYLYTQPDEAPIP